MTLTVGDLHLDKKHTATYGDVSIWDNASLETLKALIKEHNPDRVILLGDIFDTAKPPALIYAKFLDAIRYIPKVVILSGNHDLPMLKQETAFAELATVPNIHLVQPNSYMLMDKYEVAIGWCDTQDDFAAVMNDLLDRDDLDYIYVHAGRADWGNDNDNVVTDDMVKRAREVNTTIISGHEHIGYVSDHHIILGSVVPHTIGELGDRYYMLNKDVIKLPEDNRIVITREEPIDIDPDKVYAVRPKKEITVDDIEMAEKDLTIDILEDFWREATKEGFTEELLND
jgi:DNA repair exonuclease SbcCD nuclease subunit